jgi:5-methylcytosine-specific restriction endonuclease McrA
MTRATPLRRHVSARRRQLQAKRRACCKAVRERAKCLCVAGCGRRGWQVHELLPRARGGSITDPDNCVLLCAPCHRWVHENPHDAASVGLLRSKKG